jgi:hypothetical protein
VDTLEHHITHIKNHTPTNSHWEEAAERKTWTTQYTNNTEKPKKLAQTLGNRNISRIIHPRRSYSGNYTKTIHKTQTNNTSTRNFDLTRFWGFLRLPVIPRMPPF